MLLCAVMLVTVCAPPSSAASSPSLPLSHDWSFAARQLQLTAQRTPPNRYPERTSPSGQWTTTDARGWTSGFFPGLLWLMYERTGERTWKALAEKWQAGIEGQKYNKGTHDLGFMIFDSFGNAYHLTKNDQYRKVVLTAAGSLATRYNPKVGLTKSWDGPTASDFRVIIDNMMNLELLFWASKHGGSRSWYDIAVSHALHVRRDFIRPDGSTYHVVNYDPTSGKVKHRGTHQGYSDQSTWSRGQAWAVYGFTIAYRETGERRFLQTARETADYLLSHLPTDGVPYWDLNLPSPKGEPKDTSTAATAASGLLELSKLEPELVRSSRYFDRAKVILSSLSSPTYLARETKNQAILLHGTQNKPANLFDSGLIFGDYYFMEALLKYSAVDGGPPRRASLSQPLA